jgi:hypothetical protein
MIEGEMNMLELAVQALPGEPRTRCSQWERELKR